MAFKMQLPVGVDGQLLYTRRGYYRFQFRYAMERIEAGVII